MYDILKQKEATPLHNKINDHDDREIDNKSSIQQIQYKVKSGQGGICTVVTKLTISQQLGDQLSWNKVVWMEN